MAQPYEAMQYVLKNGTAVSALVGARIWHAFQPRGSAMPSLTFYEVGAPRRAMAIESQDFSVNCRATTIGAAMDLSRAVVDLFHGTSSTGIYGYENGFSIARAFQATGAILIPEPRGSAYNSPVNITIVYPSSTVS